MRCCLLIVLSFAIFGCSQTNNTSVVSEELPTSIDPVLFKDTTLNMPDAVADVYRRRNYFPLWFDSLQLTDTGANLLAIIRTADALGLSPSMYHIEKLKNYTVDSTAESIIRADVLLTDALVAMVTHVKRGRVNPLTFLVTDHRRVIDTTLTKMLAAGSCDVNLIIRKAEPQTKNYHALKQALKTMLATPLPDTVWRNRYRSIVANMERIRWSKKYPPRYLTVNIPAYELHVIEDDSIVFNSRVIVGKNETQTPPLESVITSFIIYPYWHVPKSIAVKELLPSIKNDSTYLGRHNYDVLDKNGKVVPAKEIKWELLNENNFPYTLRQRDGNENTLGIIKFVFNNRYNVYLHDTNGRKLFQREKRALSHGCVRVHKARDLAKYMVKDDEIYITPDDLEQYLGLQQRYTVRLLKPLPLFIEYSTFAIENDSVIIYEDIYGRDKRLWVLLSERENATQPVVAKAS